MKSRPDTNTLALKFFSNLSVCSAIASLLVVLCLTQNSRCSERADELRQLSSQQRWNDVVLRVERDGASADPEAEYYYGLALAKLGRAADAREVFERAWKQTPRDKRFPTELAGLAFKESNYPQAIRHLHQALRIDPQDGYASNFLATIYLLQGNTEAAIKYWNRAGGPSVADIKYDFQPRTRPDLLDRAFAFSPASTVRLDDWLTTQQRIAELGVFAQPQLQLAARDDGKFDAVFRGDEQNGFGNGKLQALASLFRGLPYFTVYPEYYNIGGKSINFRSMLRWDAQKRRAFVQLSGPLRGDPKWRYRLNFDLRSENWTIQSPSSTQGGLHQDRGAAGVEVEEILNAKLRWSSGVEVSKTSFRGEALAADVADKAMLSPGYTLKYKAQLSPELLRLPEHRLVIDGHIGAEFGRAFLQPRRSFSRAGGGLRLHWLPTVAGDDYETDLRFTGGKIFGDAPFDQLYMVGVERDNDLLLRGHPGTRDGRKGSAPIAPAFALMNWEFNKTTYRGKFFDVRLGPLFDMARVFSPLQPAYDKMLYDPGAQVKVRLLHRATIMFSYGKDLRSGRNAFYVSATR